MKKTLLTCAILSVLLFCFFVYTHLTVSAISRRAENPGSETVKEISELIDSINYPYEYKCGFFDCSNETSFLYDFLEKKGYKCEVVICRELQIESYWFHAWLIARKDGRIFLIEPTSRSVVARDYYEDFIFLMHFRSLKLLKFLSSLIGFKSEWEYWKP